MDQEELKKLNRRLKEIHFKRKHLANEREKIERKMYRGEDKDYKDTTKYLVKSKKIHHTCSHTQNEIWHCKRDPSCDGHYRCTKCGYNRLQKRAHVMVTRHESRVIDRATRKIRIKYKQWRPRIRREHGLPTSDMPE